METRITSTPRVGRVLSLAAIAGSISAIINVLLFQIGLTTGAIPGDLIIPNAGEPLSAVPVIIASIFPSLVAGVVLVILNRFTKNPLRIFNSLAVVIFLLSFFSPFSIPNAPMGMVVILELMHIVVAGAVLFIFNRFARS